jgi:hypothetical protein
VDVLNWLSDRRKSRGLEGEHKPVRCYEGGVYRTIWTAANKNISCTKQSTVILATVIPTEPTQILQTKENEEETPTVGMWWDKLFSWNYLWVFIILPLMIGAAVFVAFVIVNCVCRQSIESLVSRKGTDKSRNYKWYFFSRIPLFSSSASSDSLDENFTHSVYVLRIDAAHVVMIELWENSHLRKSPNLICFGFFMKTNARNKGALSKMSPRT